MLPKRSFWGGFTVEGKIKNLWAQAMAEPDAVTRLNSLREVLRQLREDPASLKHLWIPFLDSFLDSNQPYQLTNADLAAVEEMGNALASGFAQPLRPEDIWFRVLDIYTARIQEPQFCALLARIYISASSSWEEKARCARDLARHRDRSETALRIYFDYLQKTRSPAAEGEMIKLLSTLCAVNFTTDRVGLERAGTVAQFLLNHKLPNVLNEAWGGWTALGLYALLVQRVPTQAAHYFSNALNSNAQDKTACIGLVVSRLQLNQHRQISETAQQVPVSNFARDPIVAGLLHLSAIINWLDNQNVAGPPPGNVQTVEALRNQGLRVYADDILDGTLGRLYLLAGDAQRASALLLPLLGTNPQFPQWAYYAAWATMLTGNRDGVAYCFSNSTQWAGQWTTACLLMDTDPVLAEKSGALSFLRGILSSPMQIRQNYLPLIQTRLALAQSTSPTPVVWKRDTGSIEEDLEALRTMLGYLYYIGNVAGMERWLRHSLFARLPRPDRLFWRGLFGLHLKGAEQVQRGLQQLSEAASRYGYYRAAIVLTLYYIDKHQIKEAKRYLNIAATIRDDGRTALLRAYIAGCEGQVDSAINQFMQISYEPNIQAKAHFAAGNLSLQKAVQAAYTRQMHQLHQLRLYRQQTVERLGSALQLGKDHLPNQVEVLFHCAQFVAQPDHQSWLGVSLWNELEYLDPSQHQPWLKWNAVLGRLWYGAPGEVIAIASEIYAMIDAVNNFEGKIATTFAQALVVAATRVEQADQVEEVLRMLERLSTRSTLASVKQICRVGITQVLRIHYREANTQQRYHIRQDLMRRTATDRTNEPLALLLAAASIENGAKLAAINTLRNTHAQHTCFQRLFPYLAATLDQSAQTVLPVSPVPEPEPGSSPEVQRAYEVLHIAEAFATNQHERGYEILQRLLHQHGNELIPLIKIGRILPHLCMYATQSGGSVPLVITDTVRSFISTPTEDEQQLLLARCATAIGELDIADSLWKETLKQEQQASQPLHQEYAKFLSHRAVAAYLAGDELETVRYLRQAAGSLK